MLGTLGIYLGIFTPSGFNCQYCPGSFGLFDFENKFEGDTSPRIESVIGYVNRNKDCWEQPLLSPYSPLFTANINIKPCMYNDFK